MRELYFWLFLYQCSQNYHQTKKFMFIYIHNLFQMLMNVLQEMVDVRLYVSTYLGPLPVDVNQGLSCYLTRGHVKVLYLTNTHTYTEHLDSSPRDVNPGSSCFLPEVLLRYSTTHTQEHIKHVSS